MFRSILRVAVWVVGLVVAYGLGIVLTAALLIPAQGWAVADAQRLASRMPAGMDMADVRAMVGRAPDRATSFERDTEGKRIVPGVDPSSELDQWVVGHGRLIVSYRDRRVRWARADLESWPTAINILLAVFLGWMPLVFGESD